MDKKENNHVNNHKEQEINDTTDNKEEIFSETEDSSQFDSQKLIDDLTEKVNSLQDELLRSLAECENIRIRSAKMTQEAGDYAILSFAKDLVPVVDNLSRALAYTPENIDPETANIIEGVKMTKQELDSVFKVHGLETLEPQAGDKFDYNLHHAISQTVTEDYKEGSIVSTMQLGYKLKDRLLRPAGVVVAKAK